jgi:hypothetical protein
MKADVPKRTRVVSEHEQAKTDSRRMVREPVLPYILPSTYYRLPSIYHLQAHVVYTTPSYSSSTSDLNTEMHSHTAGQVKGGEHNKACSR